MRRVFSFTRGYGAYFLAGILLLVIFGFYLRVRIERVVDDVNFYFHPSAAYAFEIGEKHFNAIEPSRYDIVRAEHFFNIAAQDPKLPYAYHELARISFLRNDLPTALARIDLQISLHGSSTPNSYYIRGLIEGFMGQYERSAKDYETYLRTDPTNWAAINDYAWVLIKGERYTDALAAINKGLALWPENPWLLNSKATALFELGKLDEALLAAKAAQTQVQTVSEKDWSKAYPGNDPLIAGKGVKQFREAVEANIHTIEQGLEKAHQRMQ